MSIEDELRSFNASFHAALVGKDWTASSNTSRLKAD